MKTPEKVWIVFLGNKRQAVPSSMMASMSEIAAQEEYTCWQNRWSAEDAARDTPRLGPARELSKPVCYVRLPEQERERT